MPRTRLWEVSDEFWERADLFQALWQAGLSEYGELVGIQWNRITMIMISLGCRSAARLR
jgi:hypothetical protein